MAESDQDGLVLSESTLIVLSIVAIVLIAAVFPTFNIFSMLNSSSAGSLGGSPGEGAGSGSGGSGGSGSVVGGGVPGQSDLSPPPETSKISGGTNTSPGNQPLFIAKGAGSQYWRQTAYMRYTGTAWEQSTAFRPLQSGVPYDRLTRDGQQVEYEIELLTDTTSLPSVWQPESITVVNHSGTVNLEASTVGGIRSSETLVDGSTYVGVSRKPIADPAILRESEGPYPEEIELRYTQVPAATPDRVAEFGDELTADTDSPYEKAVTIRNWLRTNKEYSLNTSIDPSKPIADQFLFEVDRGYCQHYATTMAVLLRTQDVPARYVVGFSGGKPVGDGEYLVTSNNAHAWVEVYFADVGWVKFDPTPASDRALSEKPPQPPYNISLNRSAVAGAPVTIQVTKNGSAVSGAPVYVQGERIDWTDFDGEVDTQLPWEQNISIVVRPPGAETKGQEQSASEHAAVIDSQGYLPSPTDGSQLRYAIGEPSIDRIPLDTQRSNLWGGVVTGSSRTNGAGFGQSVFQTETTVNQSTENYTAETNVTIDLPESVVQGETVSLEATVKDVPLRNATVTVNGVPVGEADREGTFEFAFNNTSLGENTVSVSRGEVEGSTTIIVTAPPDPDENEENGTEESAGGQDSRSINMSVSPLFDFPVPLGPATVNVTDDAGPVGGAHITVNGNPVGETSANGTMQMRFPISKSATVSAIGPEGATDGQTIEDLYRNAAMLLGGVAFVGLCLVLIIRRLETPIQRVQNRLLAVVAVIIDAFLYLTEVVASAGYWVRNNLLGLWQEIRQISLSGVFAKLQGISIGHLRSVKNRVIALLTGLVRRVRALFEKQSGMIGSEQATDEDGSEIEFRLQDLWQEFIAVVQPPRVSTRTPGEIGRYAVSRGFPEQPVTQFIRWYRDAVYNSETEQQSRIERAKDYLSAIRDGDEQS